MLDILTIVHRFSDTLTAARIRQTCRRLGKLSPCIEKYTKYDGVTYKYLAGEKLHRLDGPSFGDEDGTSWHRGGIAHREYHPQSILRNGVIYVVDGREHREVGPSVIAKGDIWTSVGMVNRVRTLMFKGMLWYSRGIIHRKIGPAVLGTDEAWFTSGRFHRLDGSADGNTYFIRGIIHRIDDSINRAWIVNGTYIRIT